MSIAPLPLVRPQGRALIVGADGCRALPGEILDRLGYDCQPAGDPYTAMLELCRRPLAFRAMVLSLHSLYRPELAIISAVRSRYPHVTIWLTQTDGRGSSLAEAMRLGAHGLVADDGLHRFDDDPQEQDPARDTRSSARSTGPNAARIQADPAHRRGQSADQRYADQRSAGLQSAEVHSADARFFEGPPGVSGRPAIRRTGPGRVMTYRPVPDTGPHDVESQDAESHGTGSHDSQPPGARSPGTHLPGVSGPQAVSPDGARSKIGPYEGNPVGVASRPMRPADDGSGTTGPMGIGSSDTRPAADEQAETRPIGRRGHADPANDHNARTYADPSADPGPRNRPHADDRLVDADDDDDQPMLTAAELRALLGDEQSDHVRQIDAQRRSGPVRRDVTD